MDAAAQLQEWERLSGMADAAGEAGAKAEAAEATGALTQLRALLRAPVTPFDDPRITRLAIEHNVANPTVNASQLALLAPRTSSVTS